MQRPFSPLKLVWLIIPIVLPSLLAARVPPKTTTETSSRQASASSCHLIPTGTILRVDSPDRIKPASLRAGDQLRGVLPHPLFSGECEVLPEGTLVRLQVAGVIRVKGRTESSRSWTAGSLKPFNFLFPHRQYQVSLGSSEIVMSDGARVSFDPALLDVRALSVIMTQNTGRPSTAKPAGEAAESAEPAVSTFGPARKWSGSTLILRLKSPATFPRQASGTGESNAAAERAHLKEARVRLRLLQPLSASRNELGQTFLARVLNPLQLGNQLLVPEGSTVQGTIVQRKAPRRLRRAGQLRLAFGRVNLPEGGTVELAASVTALETLRDSRMTLDKEGTLRAGAATKKRAALDLGLAYVVGKAVDDVLEEGLKAGASAAATGTITSVARYVGIAAGTAFFLAHQGRDVALPEYTELEIVVTRPEAVGDTAAAEPQCSD